MDRAQPGFTAIPRRRAFEEVVLQIEEAILDGRIGIGDRLPTERDLAESFAVSRPSVREALRVLEGFGFVRAKRGTGADSGLIVSAGSDGLANLLRLHVALLHVPLDELLEIRLVIETWTAATAAERAAATDVEELERIVERMRQTTEAEDFLDHDTAFHLGIARASHNAIAPLMMAALREVIAQRMLTAFHSVDDWEAERRGLVEDHAGIVELIRRGDAAGAREAVVQHITGFYERAFADGS